MASKRKTPNYDPKRRQLTVADLIAVLATYPPELRVVVDGYEGGLDDIFLRRAMMAPNFGAHDYTGEWEQVYPRNSARPDAVDVLVLSRTDWPDADDYLEGEEHD